MPYKPSIGFRNPHINTILGGNGPRKLLLKLRSKKLRARSKDVLLQCQDNVQLHGEYTPHMNPSRGLVILIHGWEGSSNSSYLLSTASYLYQKGFSIFRLHLRDHGPTHHLNKEPFLAIRLGEVLDAIEEIQKKFSYAKNYLVGYSLGGNIAVRVAANIDQRIIRLKKVVAVCPPIDPKKAGETIRHSLIYNRYFVRKWHRSFRKKMQIFPEHQDNIDIFDRHDIISLHEAFVPRYSNHKNADSYFKAYTLDRYILKKIDSPCHLILAEDDPVVPISSIKLLPKLDGLTLETTRYGGHCGFLENYQLYSWVDERIKQLLT
tara:strand:- start:1642 stop:2601 length:960 start_codon:yes stop_codon:yes gene_type:complete